MPGEVPNGSTVLLDTAKTIIIATIHMARREGRISIVWADIIWSSQPTAQCVDSW